MSLKGEGLDPKNWGGNLSLKMGKTCTWFRF